jgi:hypothetical protein
MATIELLKERPIHIRSAARLRDLAENACGLCEAERSLIFRFDRGKSQRNYRAHGFLSAEPHASCPRDYRRASVGRATHGVDLWRYASILKGARRQ